MEKKRVLIGMPIIENVNYNVVASIINNISPYVTLGMQTGSLVYDARHKIVQSFLADEKFDYLYFWDSDTTIPRGAIDELIKHDKDIVSICYYAKQPPHQPIFFQERATREDGGVGFKHILNNDFLLNKDENGIQKLQQAVMIGLGGCLIKRKVLEEISKQQKNMFYPQFGLGEDATFCEHVTNAGYKIWVDPSLTVGHIGGKEYNYEDFMRTLTEHGHKVEDKLAYTEHVEF